ncbi:hypothetical protein R1sor_021090 [Riccia sorocarpa]|uniref:Uncharacterized protein n=1 Tax=Riccia sorocarpa TaxID=122646 RepID=A0ABD3GI61_9MARC
MAGKGANFIARVMQYVVNELLVDRLANNQSFQRFAVRSSKAIEELAEKSAQKKAELTEQMKEFTETFTSEISKGMKDGNGRLGGVLDLLCRDEENTVLTDNVLLQACIVGMPVHTNRKNEEAPK